MSHLRIHSGLAKPFTLMVICSALFSFTCMAGRDTYEIFMNDKLVAKHYAGEPLTSLTNLKLEKSNMHDQLVIHYTHCSTKGPGKGRVIKIRNEQGQVLKEYTFADLSGNVAPMTIPVKDLLELKKMHPDSKLTVFYVSSRELPDGMVLALFNNDDKSLTKS